MGPAANTSSGETRLGLSATAAAAVLYGAVVLFGLGPPPPLALGRNGDVPAPVVQLPHDAAAPGPELRGPQPSPGPAQPKAITPLRREKRAVQAPVRAQPVLAPEIAEQPAAPQPPAAEPPQPAAPAPKKDVQSTPPTPPVVVLPEAEVTITLPPLQIPDPEPALPSAPALSKLPLELPG